MTDEEFLKIVENSQSMTHASKLCGMSFNSFKRKALDLGVYNPNYSQKGIIKRSNRRYSTEDILAGKYPSFETYKLKCRLIDEGYFEDRCMKCGWCEKPEGNKYTPCELDHINGDCTDHRLENLRLLCPNCHSLTKTYRFRRGKTNEALGKKFLDANEANSKNS